MTAEQPRLALDRDPADRVLDGCGIAALVLLVGGTLWLWPSLPERIPLHFGLDGQANGWGGRGMLFLLPALGVGLFGLLTVLARVPHLYNYPFAITPENAPRQYRLARRLILAVRFWAVTLLAVLVGEISQVALDPAARLRWWSLPAMLAGLAFLLGWYFVAAWRGRGPRGA